MTEVTNRPHSFISIGNYNHILNIPFSTKTHILLEFEDSEPWAVGALYVSCKSHVLKEKLKCCRIMLY